MAKSNVHKTTAIIRSLINETYMRLDVVELIQMFGIHKTWKKIDGETKIQPIRIVAIKIVEKNFQNKEGNFRIWPFGIHNQLIK